MVQMTPEIIKPTIKDLIEIICQNKVAPGVADLRTERTHGHIVAGLTDGVATLWFRHETAGVWVCTPFQGVSDKDTVCLRVEMDAMAIRHALEPDGQLPMFRAYAVKLDVVPLYSERGADEQLRLAGPVFRGSNFRDTCVGVCLRS
jgi:hypothetical protein